MSQCGPVHGRCAQPGECCNASTGKCVTGPKECADLSPGSRHGYRYDADPKPHADPYSTCYREQQDRTPKQAPGQYSKCAWAPVPQAPPDPLPCGPKVNATCPWSRMGPDLFCTLPSERRRYAGASDDAVCLPAGDSRGPSAGSHDRVIAWTGTAWI